MGLKTLLPIRVGASGIQRKHLLGVALIIAFLAVAVYFGMQFAVNQNLTQVQTDVPSSNDIPASIVEKSNQFIVSKVGRDFFNKFIKIDFNHSRYILPDQYTLEHPESAAEFLQRPYYLMVYSFKMPEKPFVDELIEFVVDTDGNVISEREVMGVPDLINHPAEGNFPIDESQAMHIARSAGLEDGIVNWMISFHWYAGDLKTYVWVVQNTLPTPSGRDCLAYGRSVVIDANSGQVLQISQWSVVS